MIPLGFFVFARKWWKAGAGFLIGALITFPLGQCSGAAGQKKHEQADRAVAIAEALKQNAKASEKAASERLNDAREVADLKAELKEAVAGLPDAMPSERRVALGCARLSRQGVDTTRLGACAKGQSE